MSENTNNNIAVFLDAIGRTIIGNVSNETADSLSVENPAVVVVQPNVQTGQIQLQILPIFFREFQADRNVPTVWSYNKSSITRAASIEFLPQFVAQYNQLFTDAPAASVNAGGAATGGDAPVVKLFDEEDSTESTE